MAGSIEVLVSARLSSGVYAGRTAARRTWIPLALLLALIAVGCARASTPAGPDHAADVAPEVQAAAAPDVHSPPKGPAPGQLKGSFAAAKLPAVPHGPGSASRTAMTRILATDIAGSWRIVLSSGVPQPWTVVCTWQQAQLACGEPLPLVAVGIGDIDQDAMLDMVTQQGEVAWGNGAPRTDLLMGLGDRPGALEQALCRPGRVVACAHSNKDCTAPSLFAWSWGGGAVHRQDIDAAKPISYDAGLTWGSIDGTEAIVDTGQGCHHGAAPPQIFLPDAGGIFHALSPWTGDIGYSFQGAPMTAALADFNGDGHTDIIVTNDPDIYMLTGKGDGTFRFKADSNLEEPPKQKGNLLSWGVVPIDLDGDGRLDVCFANGVDQMRQTRGELDDQWPTCYWNAGEGRFVDVSKELGLQAFKGQFRDLEKADVNGDGHEDLLVSGLWQEPLLLLWQPQQAR